MGLLSNVLKSAFHDPREVVAMMKLKYGGYIPKTMTSRTAKLENLRGREFCYGVLNRVSRSFALVIQQLPDELRDPVCIFYLVLRGLDTVEDDMALQLAKKRPLLLTFHDLIYQDGWCMSGIGDTPDYQKLMERFGEVCCLRF